MAQWTTVREKGTPPGPLSKHTAVAYNNKMYIYGGVMANGETNDQLYVFEPAVHKWTVRP